MNLVLIHPFNLFSRSFPAHPRQKTSYQKVFWQLLVLFFERYLMLERDISKLAKQSSKVYFNYMQLRPDICMH